MVKKNIMSKNEKVEMESTISRSPFPNSKKISVRGKLYPEVNVFMREIELNDTKIHGGGIEKNMPITVYDTSGPYTDPSVDIDIKKGLPRLRESWIMRRGDLERLFELSSNYGSERMEDSSLDALRFEHIKMPLKAKEGRNITHLNFGYIHLFSDSHV